MKKFLLSLIISALLPLSIFAEGVPASRVIQLGCNAFQQRSHQVTTVKDVDFLTEGSDTLMAILHFLNGGFIIMAADDAFSPVVAYSLDEDFPLDNSAPAALYWLNGYKEMVYQTRQQHVAATEEVARQWQELEGAGIRATRSEVVAPLLLSKWNQSKYYNDLCPADDASPYGYGGHVPCGCVALAMASVIHYYRYPATGQGNHGYYSTYGYFSVNYSQQNYNYNVMPYSLNKKNNEVAKLIFHCAIAVEMGFDPEGSGAQTADCKNSLRDYYKYSNDIATVTRGGGWGPWGGSSYTDEQWIDLLKGDLDNGYPIIYSGYAEGEGGHAFVCDGYDSDNLFHFNWGWGGSGNGYYTVATNGNNAVGGFTGSQTVVHNIHPPTNGYPSYCQGTVTVNASAGSLEDGSGPQDYQNNMTCNYIIQPENGKSVTIGIVDLDLEEGHDYLRIYDANPDNGGNLVAEYTGNTFNPTDCPYVQGPYAYVRFTSDWAGRAAGWKLRFTSKRYVTCVANTNLTAPSGTFEDGSGDETYAQDANCLWTIKPQNATYVRLTFSQFDISSEDMVMVYDSEDEDESHLLGTYTGSALPSVILSNTGVMRVRFISDNYIERSGFAASWYSDGEEVQDPEDPEDPENAVSDFNDFSLEVFPNPAHEQVSVLVPASFRNGQLRIADLNGRVVRTLPVNPSSELNVLSVSDLSCGVYVISVMNDNDIAFKKLIISR
ncbi:MAG: C10 family peptidase [Bacteroidales bacterium]|nr:C10 family peptidase [Bacteroidales bacterium]